MEDLFDAIARMSDGVMAIDDDHRIILWNRGAERILGYRAEEVLGKYCYEAIVGYDRCGAPQCRRGCAVIAASIKGRPVPNYDLQAKDASGRTLWLNVSILPLKSESGDLSSVVHLFHDVSDQVALEDLIREGVALANRAGLVPDPARPTLSSGEGEDIRALVNNLTGREREVLQFMAKGFGTTDISEELSLSPATVRNHIQAVLDKLHVHSRMEAVAYAVGRGIV